MHLAVGPVLGGSRATMALFGTTYHGDYNQLLHAQPIVNAVDFHEVSDEEFETAFHEQAMGDCPTASALQVRTPTTRARASQHRPRTRARAPTAM